MIHYVVGFAFDSDWNVALIRKARPDWQKGRLNGVGGHIEDGESSHEAMVREFEEETGLKIPSWELFVTLRGEDWDCYFYRSFNVDLKRVSTMTDEEVMVRHPYLLPHDVLPNLLWLIPLALDFEPRVPNLIVYGSHAERDEHE